MRTSGTRPRWSSSRPPWSPLMTAGSRARRPVLVMTVIRAGGPVVSSSMIAMHTAIPRPARRLLLVNTEAIAERSQEPYNFAGIVDISDETAPRRCRSCPSPCRTRGPDTRTLAAGWPVRTAQPAPPAERRPEPVRLRRPAVPHLVQRGPAGLRHPGREPAARDRLQSPRRPHRASRGAPKDLVTQSEDVLVDACGYIYLSDKK